MAPLLDKEIKTNYWTRIPITHGGTGRL